VAKRAATRVAFGDVVRLSKERTSDPDADGFDRYVGLEHIDPGDLRIHRWGDVADGTTFTNVFRPGQVLFGKRRAYQRKVAVPNFEGVCSGDIYVLESNDPTLLLPELLPFICQTEAFLEHAVGTSAGSLSPRTNWASLASYEFDLTDADTQRRGAAALGAVEVCQDRLIDATKALQAVTNATLQELFPTAASNALPQDLVALGELAGLQVGYPFRSAHFVEEGVRLLRGSNVGVDEISWEPAETRYWPLEQAKDFSQYELSPGDIIIAMDRPFVSKGFKAARIETKDLPALLLQRVGRLSPSSPELSDLVWAFVHSASFQSQLMAQQQGTDLPHISKSQIESTTIPRAALEAVDRVAMFGHCYASRYAFADRQAQLSALKRGIAAQVLA
jgi:type I restriction enzyme S subunit